MTPKKDERGCYRDPKTGQFVCKPGTKPAGRPGAKPAGKPGAKPKHKPRGGWFPMPDQRNDRYSVASRRTRKPDAA
jgi:hypothetical protein